MSTAPADAGRASRQAAVVRTSDALLRRYARERMPADLDRLVRRFQPLARSLARRYRLSSVAADDLEQAAYLGLVNALQRFDPGRGCAFTTYAVPTILGEIRRQCREAAWPAHVPRVVKERARHVRAHADDLRAELGRPPTVAEIATRVGCGQEDVVEALAAASTLNRVSLDQCRAEEGDDGAPLVASLGEDDPAFELAEYRADIERAIPQLDDAERLVLRLRFADERTFAEIGQELALAPGQAARLAKKSLDHLRALTVESGPALVA
jgi:RNA polymerase sigma-B factor